MLEGRLAWALAIVASLGCGAAKPEGTGAPAEASSAVGPSEQQREIAKRLEGTWEIARYESSEPVPPEAMELMARMFEELTLTFAEQSVTVGSETTSFSVADEDGEAFTMIAKGGMFDGARCRFVADDELEIDDKGQAWPGTTTLRRLDP